MNLKAVNTKVAFGFGLTLKELAVKTGYSYETARKWKGQGLPLLSGKITYEDFLVWKARHMGLESAPRKNERSRASIVGKSG